MECGDLSPLWVGAERLGRGVANPVLGVGRALRCAPPFADARHGTLAEAAHRQLGNALHAPLRRRVTTNARRARDCPPYLLSVGKLADAPVGGRARTPLRAALWGLEESGDKSCASR